MKFLVSADFKVLRKGEVVADDSVGEFIYDTEENNSERGKGFFEELAKQNKIKISKKLDIESIINVVNEAIMNSENIPMQTEDTEVTAVKVNKDLEKVKEIVLQYREQNQDDDDSIMVEIIKQGISFKKAGRLYQQALEALGVRVSKKDRNQKIDEYLASIEFAPENSDDVLKVVEALTVGEHAIEDTNAGQVIAAIKRYAKQHNIDLPEIKKPKTAKGGRGAGGGFKSKFKSWVLKNKDASDEEVKQFVLDAGKPENLADALVAWVQFARDFASA